jgi:hypothetical protein
MKLFEIPAYPYAMSLDRIAEPRGLDLPSAQKIDVFASECSQDCREPGNSLADLEVAVRVPILPEQFD